MPRTDPDDMLVVLFKHIAVLDPVRTKEAGREIFDDMEVCEVRAPGNKDVKVFPAASFARWLDDPFTGEQTKQTYAERFKHQYMQFKAKAAQTKSGTPLEMVPFLTEGRKAELRAQNVYTVEQLAAIEGSELKNLGPGGREMKNHAADYIEESRGNAPNLQMLAELEAMKARNAVLEEDVKILAERAKEKSARDDAEFDRMSLPELRDYITTQTGQAPVGSLNRKTLLRMASEARPDKAA
jgi:hypothetical protein